MTSSYSEPLQGAKLRVKFVVSNPLVFLTLFLVGKPLAFSHEIDILT